MATKEVVALRWLIVSGSLVPPICVLGGEYLKTNGFDSHPLGATLIFLGLSAWPTSFTWMAATAYSPWGWNWILLFAASVMNSLAYLVLGSMFWFGTKDWRTNRSNRWLAVVPMVILLP